MTYRAFSTSYQLSSALICRYNSTYEEERIIRIRYDFARSSSDCPRTLNVFRQWIEKYWYDIEKDNKTQTQILEFLGSVAVISPNSQAAISIKAKLEKQVQDVAVRSHKIR